MPHATLIMLCAAVCSCIAGGARVDDLSDPNPGPDAGLGPPPLVGDAGDTAADGSPDIDTDGDSVSDAFDNCPRLANSGQSDGDGDGAGDACDCEPGDAAIGAVVMEPRLSAPGDLTPAAGFSDASWSFTGEGLRQTALADERQDALLFDTPISGNLYIEVGAASTEIANFGTDDLRQIFIFAGQANQSELSGIGCGIEVVEGLATTQQTTIVELAGTPAPVAFDVIERIDRAPVVENELFTIRATIQNGFVTCSVTLDGNDRTTTSGQVENVTSLGLYTRETKALFSDLRVCQLN